MYTACALMSAYKYVTKCVHSIFICNVFMSVCVFVSLSKPPPDQTIVLHQKMFSQALNCIFQRKQQSSVNRSTHLNLLITNLNDISRKQTENCRKQTYQQPYNYFYLVHLSSYFIHQQDVSLIYQKINKKLSS